MAVVCTICHKATTVSSDGGSKAPITAELPQLEERVEGASQETIALEKANYFAGKELWSDALRELSSVPTPSVELKNAIALLQAHDLCAKDEPNVSASR